MTRQVTGDTDHSLSRRRWQSIMDGGTLSQTSFTRSVVGVQREEEEALVEEETMSTFHITDKSKKTMALVQGSTLSHLEAAAENANAEIRTFAPRWIALSKVGCPGCHRTPRAPRLKARRPNVRRHGAADIEQGVKMKCADCNYTPRHRRYEPLAHDYCSSPTPTQGYRIAVESSVPSSVMTCFCFSSSPSMLSGGWWAEL
ncbi:hypothetical protein EYF80_031372 [Liparis tanakae]|uniref:Uncharacterized protein n=1 Tax=Liparis tanakae TaxID=230148 RepID=A0A4Z2GYQ2_9TELE|nr:hypothetical protein EYF80_031372 [Liparis tanakae]